MQETPTKGRSKLIRKTLHSRNFLHFAISATFVTGVFLYLLNKCNGETFDHVSADMHFNTWGNNICLLAAIFLFGESAKGAIAIFRAKQNGGQNTDQHFNP